MLTPYQLINILYAFLQENFDIPNIGVVRKKVL